MTYCVVQRCTVVFSAIPTYTFTYHVFQRWLTCVDRAGLAIILDLIGVVQPHSTAMRYSLAQRRRM